MHNPFATALSNVFVVDTKSGPRLKINLRTSRMPQAAIVRANRKVPAAFIPEVPEETKVQRQACSTLREGRQLPAREVCLAAASVCQTWATYCQARGMKVSGIVRRSWFAKAARFLGYAREYERVARSSILTSYVSTGYDGLPIPVLGSTLVPIVLE